MVALPALILQVDESFAQSRQPAATTPSGHPAAPASAPASGPSASAATPVGAVSAEIMVLHASNSGGGIDPKVRDLPQLKKPPFSSYNTYRVLSQSQVSLPLGRTIDTTLPNGGQFRLSFREAAPSNRFKLAATILQPNGQSFLPSLEVTLPHHEPFFIGAQSHKDGKLVLAVKLLK
ncbi:MAG: hypothetical protein EOO75_00810 [Myxococcales bacterium]|nr:MAG: hypothetical protein EOO75_00810 [Myxococcales bacterium]